MVNGKLTAKQEKFVVEYIRLNSVTEASLLAGYSSHTALTIGSENLSKPNIQARIGQLKSQMASEKVLSVVQRKEILSTTARTPSESPPTHRDRTSAIGELNRMERIYEVGATINQDNRTVNIYVGTERAKELLGRVRDRFKGKEGGDND